MKREHLNTATSGDGLTIIPGSQWWKAFPLAQVTVKSLHRLDKDEYADISSFNITANGLFSTKTAAMHYALEHVQQLYAEKIADAEKTLADAREWRDRQIKKISEE